MIILTRMGLLSGNMVPRFHTTYEQVWNYISRFTEFNTMCIMSMLTGKATITRFRSTL